MNCEEYVVDKLQKVEGLLKATALENKNLQDKVSELEGYLKAIKEMTEVKQGDDYRKFEISIYDKYDKKEYDILANIFEMLEEEDENW